MRFEFCESIFDCLPNGIARSRGGVCERLLENYLVASRSEQRRSGKRLETSVARECAIISIPENLA